MSGTTTLLVGDAEKVLATLADRSVHSIVTSPPYWGLRDYGTASWDGGDLDCDHLGPVKATQAGFNERYFGAASKASDKQGDLRVPFTDMCGKCGGRRIDSQLGLERSPEDYVRDIVQVFREARRVLRDDGTLWLNLGDCYTPTNYGPNAKRRRESPNSSDSLQGRVGQWHSDLGGQQSHDRYKASVAIGLKNKDLVGIPWRVAFALQADGWYLRSDIVWAKPNPMPESIRDRPTKSHEYVFLMAKSERYYYDSDAVKEPAVYQPGSRPDKDRGAFGGKWAGVPGKEAFRSIAAKRNRRSVWFVATQPFRGAHFATFPEKLITPMILAGTPPGGTVLDPFGGSGTVGVVAERHGRNAILIDLNPDYIDMAARRVTVKLSVAEVAA